METPLRQAVVAIIGQTATGKSALALRLAETFDGEIITADSRQVYRYMDIGTDKPSLDHLARCPHHMIDLVDPDQPFTLADYQHGAYECISQVHGRARLPILAGGTPLYVNSVLEGWTIPRVEPDHALRNSLKEKIEQVGSEALHRRLLELDPQAASNILPTNGRRIIRALEVIIKTGKRISDQQGKTPPGFPILQIGLSCDRLELYRRIDARVDRQIRRGLADEVAGLHARGYSYDLPSMSGLGYRQMGSYLQGKSTLAEAVQRIKWDTHSFARHQGNWFRRSTTALWLDAASRDPVDTAVSAVGTFLHRTST